MDKLSLTMASVTISNVLLNNTVDDVRRAFTQINIGVIDSIEQYYEIRDVRPIIKYTIRFSSIDAKFHERLIKNAARKGDPTVEHPILTYAMTEKAPLFWRVHLAEPPESIIKGYVIIDAQLD